MYGSPRFHLAAKRLDIRALIGAEVMLPEKCRYTLLAENRNGYQNLCRLITRTSFATGTGKPENPFAARKSWRVCGRIGVPDGRR